MRRELLPRGARGSWGDTREEPALAVAERMETEHGSKTTVGYQESMSIDRVMITRSAHVAEGFGMCGLLFWQQV
jgi:hypothetical protein